MFPLYIFENQENIKLLTNAQACAGNEPVCNLSSEFLSHIGSVLDVSDKDGNSTDEKELLPNNLFGFLYAILNSPGYRTRYAEFLKIDFPRIPLPGSPELFHNLAQLGGELVALHLLESPTVEKPITKYIGPASPEVGRVGWSDDTVWIDAPTAKKGQPQKPGSIGFRGIPEEVWNFHIGGYQVCHKWLKDRKGRTLSPDDIAHYQKIVVALSETIRLMRQIDEVIETHGGWPGAFHSGPLPESKESPPPFA